VPRNNPEERSSQIVLLIQVYAKGGANRKFITSHFFLKIRNWRFDFTKMDLQLVSSMFCHLQSYFSFMLS